MGVVPIRLIVQRYEEEAKATNFDCVFFIQQTIVSELSTPFRASFLAHDEAEKGYRKGG